jgi:hypothetical protein
MGRLFAGLAAGVRRVGSIPMARRDRFQISGHRPEWIEIYCHRSRWNAKDRNSTVSAPLGRREKVAS